MGNKNYKLGSNIGTYQNGSLKGRYIKRGDIINFGTQWYIALYTHNLTNIYAYPFPLPGEEKTYTFKMPKKIECNIINTNNIGFIKNFDRPGQGAMSWKKYRSNILSFVNIAHDFSLTNRERKVKN